MPVVKHVHVWSIHSTWNGGTWGNGSTSACGCGARRHSGSNLAMTYTPSTIGYPAEPVALTSLKRYALEKTALEGERRNAEWKLWKLRQSARLANASQTDPGNTTPQAD